MDIFKRYESDDSEELFDHDEFVDEEVEEVGRSGPLLVRAAIALIAVIGISYGANISLNDGNRLEFGQGQILTTAVCDTNSGITVTPYAGFINETGTGKFVLDSILLENVDKNCVGKDFIIKVFSNSSSTPLTISESSIGGGNYATYNSVRFYFQDASTVSLVGSQYTDIDVLTDNSTTTEFDANQSSFLIVFDADQTSSFGDATEIYKITLESTTH